MENIYSKAFTFTFTLFKAKHLYDSKQLKLQIKLLVNETSLNTYCMKNHYVTLTWLNLASND